MAHNNGMMPRVKGARGGGKGSRGFSDNAAKFRGGLRPDGASPAQAAADAVPIEPAGTAYDPGPPETDDRLLIPRGELDLPLHGATGAEIAGFVPHRPAASGTGRQAFPGAPMFAASFAADSLVADLPRHTHDGAYAALVIGGDYEEAGDHGRVRAHAGHVVLHECFEAHLDRIGSGGARVINVALPAGVHVPWGHGRLADPDSILAAPREQASALLLSLFRPMPLAFTDWPDLLAARLLADPFLNLEVWADAAQLAPWTVSRGFRRVFGVTPSQFRLRARARRAWNRIRGTHAPLAAIAADCGFADQAHMTRAVRALTGRPPLAWRGCK